MLAKLCQHRCLCPARFTREQTWSHAPANPRLRPGCSCRPSEAQTSTSCLCLWSLRLFPSPDPAHPGWSPALLPPDIIARLHQDLPFLPLDPMDLRGVPPVRKGKIVSRFLLKKYTACCPCRKHASTARANLAVKQDSRSAGSTLCRVLCKDPAEQRNYSRKNLHLCRS